MPTRAWWAEQWRLMEKYGKTPVGPTKPMADRGTFDAFGYWTFVDWRGIFGTEGA